MNITQELIKSNALVLAQQLLLSEISHIFNVFTCNCSWGGDCSEGGHGHNLVPITIKAPTQEQAKNILIQSLNDTLIAFLKNDGYYKKGADYVKIFSITYKWDGYSIYGKVEIVADLVELAQGDVHFIRYVKLLKALLDLVFDPDTDCIPTRNIDISKIDYDNINIKELFRHHLNFMEPIEFNTIEEYFRDI